MTGIAASGPMSPSQHGRAVGDHGDGVLLDRVLERLVRIGGDLVADARDARRVGHREVVARLERHLQAGVDLSAPVQLERAVGDLDQLDAVELLDDTDHLVPVRLVRAVDRDLAQGALLGLDEDVDCADLAARLPIADVSRPSDPGRRSSSTRRMIENCALCDGEAMAADHKITRVVPDKRELFLIDGNSLAYRAFYALPETIATSTGQPTNAIFGFASMLVKILTEYGSQPTLVAWDAGMSGREAPPNTRRAASFPTCSRSSGRTCTRWSRRSATRTWSTDTRPTT